MNETETAKIEDRKEFEALVSRLARDSWDDARTAAELLAVLDSGCEMALENLERRSAELTASLSREAALVEALDESRKYLVSLRENIMANGVDAMLDPTCDPEIIIDKIDTTLKTHAA